MRLNPYIVFMFMVFFGLIVGAGCRKRAETPPPPLPDVATAKEVKPLWVDPFLDAAKGDVSVRSADNLGKFYVSGLVILLAAIGVRLFTGSWKDALIVSGLGTVPAVVAVLLTDYPRVVLLVPACGLAILITHGIKRLVEWRTGYRAWQATAEVIEKEDTGKNSIGQRIKDKFKEAGIADTLDKALEPLEKLWKKQPPNQNG